MRSIRRVLPILLSAVLLLSIGLTVSPGEATAKARKPVIKLAQGSEAPAGHYYGIRLRNFTPRSVVRVTCHDAERLDGFRTLGVRTNRKGRARVTNQCYSESIVNWVTAGETRSDDVVWEENKDLHQVVDGRYVGVQESNYWTWDGKCRLVTFDGGPYVPVLVSTSSTAPNAKSFIVQDNMHRAWAVSGGPNAIGCPKRSEVASGDGVEQKFQRGVLYWEPGLGTIRLFKACNGKYTLKEGMLKGWAKNGSSSGIGCPRGNEFPSGRGVKQYFRRGTLYWEPGFDAARLINPCMYNMRWDKTHLTYRYEGEQRYLGNVIAGTEAWSSTGLDFSIRPAADGEKADIVVRDVDIDGKGIGFVDVPPSWWGPRNKINRPRTPDQVVVSLNTKQMDDLNEKSNTDAKKTYVVIHELGHAVGLAHTENCGLVGKHHFERSATPTVMISGPAADPNDFVLTIQWYDKMSLAHLYDLETSKISQ